MYFIGLYRESTKIFLSETIKPKTLIFDMSHDLVDLYQFCSNYVRIQILPHMFCIGLLGANK